MSSSRLDATSSICIKHLQYTVASNMGGVSPRMHVAPMAHAIGYT